jgi:hypothetical protein
VTDLFDQTLTRTIKAISLWQPWATLVARGLKTHETRHWPTEHRGPIAIHAAKTLDLVGAPVQLCHRGLGRAWWAECPQGAIVAIARLRTCVSTDAVFRDLTRADEAAGDFSQGRFAWRLGDIRRLVEPIPALGRQGLFNWAPPQDIEDRLGPALDHEAICAAIGWGRA